MDVVALLYRSRPGLELKFTMSLAFKDPGVTANTTAAGATGTGGGIVVGTGITGGLAAISFSRFRSEYR